MMLRSFNFDVAQFGPIERWFGGSAYLTWKSAVSLANNLHRGIPQHCLGNPFWHRPATVVPTRPAWVPKGPTTLDLRLLCNSDFRFGRARQRHRYGRRANPPSCSVVPLGGVRFNSLPNQ